MTSRALKVLILGGYGTFGGRLAQLLATGLITHDTCVHDYLVLGLFINPSRSDYEPSL